MNRQLHHLVAGLLVLACSAGCHDDDKPASEDPDAPFCDGYTQLAADVGCSAKPDCTFLKPSCEALARRWLACVRKDLKQCICESDDEINCEGSFKPNEGPALCLEEYRRFDACIDDE